jgi:hypothetical protein
VATAGAADGFLRRLWRGFLRLDYLRRSFAAFLDFLRDFLDLFGCVFGDDDGYLCLHFSAGGRILRGIGGAGSVVCAVFHVFHGLFYGFHVGGYFLDGFHDIRNNSSGGLAKSVDSGVRFLNSRAMLTENSP